MRSVLGVAWLAAFALVASRPSQAEPPRTTLGAALDHETDAGAEPRGRLLLALAPESTAPSVPTQGLASVAAAFGRRPLHVGGVTVLAPEHMVLLSEPPTRTDPLNGLDTRERLRLLLGSLVRAQWARIGGAPGLGRADLSAKQRALFDALLPDPMRIARLPLDEDDASGELSPAQRAGVRLRLERVVTYSFTHASGRSFAGGGDLGASPGDGGRYIVLHPGERREEVFGVPLSRSVPNRLKPGDVDFAAAVFDTAIPLEGATTLGELVGRAARATKTELYADARLAGLRLWHRGTAPARSGDVLKALCLATTGAFRRVGPAFVLTESREGLGARRARLADRLRDLEEEGRAIEETARRNLLAAQPWRFLRVAGDGGTGGGLLGPGVERRMEQVWQNPHGAADGVRVALADLPAPLQARIREQWQKDISPDEREKWLVEQVLLRPDLRLSYLVPGLNAPVDAMSVEWRSLLPLPGGIPAPDRAGDGLVVLPQGPAVRALRVAPGTSDDLSSLAREAKRRGLNQLWVDVSEVADAAAAVTLLTRAVAAGKEQGLPVVATFRLLRRGPIDRDAAAGEPAVPGDLNVCGESATEYAARRLRARPDDPWTAFRFGEAREWRRIDSPADVAGLGRRLRGIAGVPGIAGVALTDTAAPGYARTRNDADVPRAGEDLGYTPEMRLGFLREAGVDPIDIDPMPVYLPFFPGDDWDLRARWDAFRYRANARTLAALFVDLRRAAPGVPLWIAERGESYGHWPPLWFGSWDRADTLPRRTDAGRTEREPPLYERARRVSRRALQAITLLPEVPPINGTAPPERSSSEALTELLRWRLGKEASGGGVATRWDGFVLDWSGMPSGEVPALLTALAVVSP